MLSYQFILETDQARTAVHVDDAPQGQQSGENDDQRRVQQESAKYLVVGDKGCARCKAEADAAPSVIEKGARDHQPECTDPLLRLPFILVFLWARSQFKVIAVL